MKPKQGRRTASGRKAWCRIRSLLRQLQTVMQVTINGQARELPEGATAGQVVSILGLQGQRLAMEVNQEILPRSEFDHHTLVEGDVVEIVRAIGGG